MARRKEITAVFLLIVDMKPDVEVHEELRGVFTSRALANAAAKRLMPYAGGMRIQQVKLDVLHKRGL